MAAPYRTNVDVAIVGSGFAGSLAALALRKIGCSVALLERGRHPRSAIGESSTPLANLLIEELSDRYGLERVRPLSKWGTWQQQYPAIAGGLKRGFSFYRHDLDAPFRDDSDHGRQLLVAASPHDGIGDTHWYRPDVDAFLVREAESAGAEYLDETTLTDVDVTNAPVVVAGVRQGRPVRVEARFLIDASGARGFVQRALRLPEQPLRWLPPTQAVYSHFTGVDWWRDEASAIEPEASPPFPVDLAALHHVFPGGWMWVLRFNNGITSAGAALTDPLAASLRLDEAGAWDRLLARLPSIANQFQNARETMPFVYAPRLAYRSAVVTGPNWALLPSAAGVIDPLLSTGFPLTLLGIQRLLGLLEDGSRGSETFGRALADYGRQTIRELDVTEQLVGALYASMHDFERFKRLTLLYFAAASFSEASRRLGRPDRARGFLLCDDPSFGPELRACAEAATPPSLSAAEREALFARIDRAIEPFDVAGLRDGSRRDWYAVLADDLIEAAPKLQASADDVQRLLERSGFTRRSQPAAMGS
jgi:FADH2 O2-dependent halogenase